MDDSSTVFVDLKGLKCPYPVLRTEKKLARLATGSLLAIETTDALAAIDIPHFCHEKSHALIKCEPIAGGHRFLIRKGG